MLRSDAIVDFEIIERILNHPSAAISTQDEEALNNLRVIPDFAEVIRSNMQINQEYYNNLVAGRFLPGLIHANSLSTQENKAIITIPGVGCGQFAGHLQGQMATHLDIAIKTLLSKHAVELQNIALVRFDPYNECLRRGNEEVSYGDLKYRVRPLTEELGKTQLCNPIDYQEAGDNFATHKLFKLVAWDHVSLPANEGRVCNAH